MPGVPSSRGCAACRKCKKRCDLARPSCARCTRLSIPCVGAGQQRFKFAANSSTALVHYSPPGRPLYNEVTIACGSFVSTLVVTDPRYDVTNLGGFLEHVPARLGRNKALDVCARAFTGAMASVRAERVDVQALTDYGTAMRVLREYLGDPQLARMPETLVATYLLSLCQVYLVDDDDDNSAHMRGLALLIEGSADEDWHDPFHGEVLTACAFSVMLANIVQPSSKSPLSIRRITSLVYGPKRSPWQLEGLETFSLQFENLERLPDLVESPQVHLDEMRCTYTLMELEARRISEVTASFLKECGDLTTESPTELLKLYFAHDAVNMMLLSLCLILNKMLRLAEPQNTALQFDAGFLTTECVAAAQRTAKFKPLGCSIAPLCLVVVQATGVEVDLWDCPLMDKFIKLGCVLQAKFRAVEANFKGISGQEVAERDAACSVM